jgi:hypothetical protein
VGPRNVARPRGARTDHRWALSCHPVSYAFDVGEFGRIGTVRDNDGGLGQTVDAVSPWPFTLWLGGWDADAP